MLMLATCSGSIIRHWDGDMHRIELQKVLRHTFVRTDGEFGENELDD